jgi:RNA 3'-terminal phosphate cyclase (ATP)
VRAEKVADRAAGQLQAWLEKGITVDEFTADQLLLPMVLAGGGSFKTASPTQHTTTNAQVIAQFYGVNIQMTHAKDSCTIRIELAATGD